MCRLSIRTRRGPKPSGASLAHSSLLGKGHCRTSDWPEGIRRQAVDKALHNLPACNEGCEMRIHVSHLHIILHNDLFIFSAKPYSESKENTRVTGSMCSKRPLPLAIAEVRCLDGQINGRIHHHAGNTLPFH